MTSFCRHLSGQEIVNWVWTADGCVHTADTTQLDSFVASASAVYIGHKVTSGSAASTAAVAQRVIVRAVVGLYRLAC